MGECAADSVDGGGGLIISYLVPLMTLSNIVMGEMSAPSTSELRRAGEYPDKMTTPFSSVVTGKSFVDPFKFQKTI